MKDNITTAVGAAVLVAAGFMAGVMVPEPPCEDGQLTAAEFTLAGREPVALTMDCKSGRWVIDPNAHPRKVGGRE